MSSTNIKALLDNLSPAIEAITDPAARFVIEQLLKIIEMQAEIIDELRAENQTLRNEVSRLKGEKGKPAFRKQTSADQDVSSEKERRGKPKKKKSKKKKDKINVDREQLCTIAPDALPDDAVFKGHSTVVIQDIQITTDNIAFKKEVYYSPSLKKTFMAALPPGYEGEFGPHLKAVVLALHNSGKMTESAILTFLRHHGIVISSATISRMITEKHDSFHQEKADIVQAGLASSTHQQMDDTGARVKGKNHYTHILCNALYTAFFTRRHKNRLTVLEILVQGPLSFRFDGSAYDLMVKLKLPNKTLKRLKALVRQTTMSRAEVEQLLEALFSGPQHYKTYRQIILEGSAIAAYQRSPEAIELLLTDDAPQYKKITELLALCWIHDARHYKKLKPVVPRYRRAHKAFLTRYWDYYRLLLAYKEKPNAARAESLIADFDGLFSTTTGYERLDERIARTRQKKETLLLVLEHPNLPLHNNASELGARAQARYRDISFHTMSEKGTQAHDTFMTLVETAKKLSVNTYQYFYDRITQRYEMPALASLIMANAEIAAPG